MIDPPPEKLCSSSNRFNGYTRRRPPSAMLRSRQQRRRVNVSADGLRHEARVLHPVRVSGRRLWAQLVLGLALVAGGARLLVWSEERLLQKTLSLDEGLQGIISVADPNTVSPQNDGKLVHVVGPLEVGEPLTEPEYGVSVPAVKLKRRVQMYQWVEEHTAREPDEQTGGLSENFYFTEWRDKLIDSTKFAQPAGHQNPKEFPLKTTTYVSEHVNVGAYYFGIELKERCTDFTLITSDERPERKDIKLHSGLYYHSQDVWNPEVGDTRVQFSYCGLASDVVTVIAQQHEHELQPYETQTGDYILIVEPGRSSIGELFSAQHKQHSLLSWFVRASCALLIFSGCSYVTAQLRPWGVRYATLRSILAGHTGAINLSATASISLSIVALTWLAFRPLLGGLLLVSAGLPLAFFVYLVYAHALAPQPALSGAPYRNI